jgi:hypothetical protein
MKYANYDIGRIYTTPPGPVIGEAAVNALPQFPPTGTALPGSSDVDEDFWGIARVNQIIGDGPDADSVPDSSATDPILFSASAAQEITAIFWGGIDVYVAPGGFADVTEIRAVGLQASFFVDDSPDYSAIPGPAARVDIAGVPTYPGTTDGTLAWTFVGSPLGIPLDPTAAEFRTFFSPTGAFPGGIAALGELNLELAPNSMGVGAQQGLLLDVAGADATADFTGRLDALTPPWTVASDDPLLTAVIPLPSSAYMGAVGLLGVAFGAWRRSRRSA